MKEPIDHTYTDEAVCPYCGYEFSDSWELSDNGTYTCHECEKDFEVERIVSCVYVTSKIKADRLLEGGK